MYSKTKLVIFLTFCIIFRNPVFGLDDAIIDAGDDQIICNGDSAPLSATFNSDLTITWATTGDGIFIPDNKDPNATYEPGENDRAGLPREVTITLTGDDSQITDNMVITIWPMPVVSAGFDVVTCEDHSVVLIGAVQNATQFAWSSSSGIGTFTSPNSLETEFFADPQDYGSTIQLILTVSGPGGTCGEISDELNFESVKTADVNAGEDFTTCFGETFNLNGVVSDETFSVEWEGGTGLFSNIFSANTTYTPTILDPNPLVLTLVARDPIGVCADIRSDITISFDDLPFVDAGSDAQTCIGEAIDLSELIVQPVVQNYTTLLWSGGEGSFDDPEKMLPVYTPAEGESGVITLFLEAYGEQSCATEMDFISLTILPEPTVFAGGDKILCSLEGFELSALDELPVVNEFSALTWSVLSGGGSIERPNDLLPVYYPAAEDEGQVVILQLEAYGNGNCPSSLDELELTFEFNDPVVSAGADMQVCQGEQADFATSSELATAENYEILEWTHDGDGVLDNSTGLSPIYIPGDGETGIITFTLSATGCSSVTDELQLTIHPFAEVDAGPDQITFEDSPIKLNTASAENYSSILWSSNGGGSFDDPQTLHPTYSPSSSDAGTELEFTITVNGMGSCAAVTDVMHLRVEEVTSINEDDLIEGYGYTQNNHFILVLGQKLKRAGDYTIYDLNGRYAANGELPAGQDRYRFPAGQFPPGVYLLNLDGQVFKFLKN